MPYNCFRRYADEPAPGRAGDAAVVESEIFISHAQEDHETAARICQALEAAGLKCWIAPRDIRPGEAWAASIVSAIERSRGLLVILSSYSIASRQVAREVQLSDASHTPLLAVRIDATELSGELEYFLLNTQWYDATSEPVDQKPDALVGVVRGLLAGVATGKDSVAAPEWKQGSRGMSAVRWMLDEFRRAITTWFAVVSQGKRYFESVDYPDLRTLTFALRFLVYMQVASALISLSLFERGGKGLGAYVLSYTISGVVEVFGAVFILHWCFRMVRGNGTLQASTITCCLYSAFAPMITLFLAPIRSYLEPFFRMDPTKASLDQMAAALPSQVSGAGLVIIIACAMASSLALFWMFVGIFRSLRCIHQVSVARSAAAVVAALVGYAVYLVVVAMPFTRILYL